MFFVLRLPEDAVILDGVVDRSGSEDGVEFAPVRGDVVLGENGVDDGALGKRFAGFGRVLAVGLVVIDVKTQDVFVFDGVGDGVFVQRFLKEVFGGLESLDIAFDALGTGVFVEDRRVGKAE